MHRLNRRKTLIAIIVATTLMAALFLVGCGSNASKDADKVEQKTYPLVTQLQADQPPTKSEMNLYFVDGTDIPYVSITEFMAYYASFYDDPETGESYLSFNISYPSKMHVLVDRPDNGSYMTIDAEKDTVDFGNFDAFIQFPGSSTLLGLVTLGKSEAGGIGHTVQSGGLAYDRNGHALTFDFSKYNINLVWFDNECYVPLQTLNDIFLAPIYINTIFNGETVVAFGYGIDLGEQIYSVSTGKMSEEFATFNYNELRFMFDNFYGLSAEHDIDEFGEFFLDTGLIDGLSGTDPVEFDNALKKFLGLYIDDLHTAFLARSYLSPDTTANASDDPMANLADAVDNMGISSNTSSFSNLTYAMKRATYYPQLASPDPEVVANGPFLYEEVGDTAIVTFDKFLALKNEYSPAAEVQTPHDTIELIAYAHQQITREGSPIKNIVLDLSNNPGGMTDVAAFTAAWFSGVPTFAVRNTLTGAQTVGDYEADINLDGEFDEDDFLPDGIKFYCLISPRSFSCGNLVPASFKYRSNVTLIGHQSGGGSCIVRPFTTASGASFQISGTSQLSIVRNGSFYNIDQGVAPDVYISDLDTFYDRQRLVEFIHSLN